LTTKGIKVIKKTHNVNYVNLENYKKS